MKRLFTCLGILAVLASSLPLAARAAWVFELTSHFRVQLVALLLLLALAFAVRRAWGWCAALALGIAANAPPLVPYLLPPPARAASGDPAAAFTVLTVNVEAFNDEHAGLIAGITRTRPDVVLVVEFTERWGEHLAPLDDAYPYQQRLTKPDPFGIALLSRWPLASVAELELGPVSAIDARVATPLGAVRLIGVHLLPPLSPAWARGRNAQLTALVSHAAATPEPLIVLGDFNVSPYSPFFRDWLAQTRLTDARLGFGLGFTWPAFFPVLGVPIDHVVVSDALAVTGYRRLPAFGSDHYPVLVELSLEETT